jgi:hypothetical protein
MDSSGTAGWLLVRFSPEPVFALLYDDDELLSKISQSFIFLTNVATSVLLIHNH